MPAVSLTKTSSGFTLVESLIAISLLLLLAVGSLAANSLTTGSIVINQQRSKANFLAREGMEAVLSARAANFTVLRSGVYHPVLGPSGWILLSGAEEIGTFTRTITLSQVMRSLSCTTQVCDIVAAGGVVDEGTYKAEVKVDWKESGQDKSYVLDTYITYWR